MRGDSGVRDGLLVHRGHTCPRNAAQNSCTPRVGQWRAKVNDGGGGGGSLGDVWELVNIQ